MVSNSHIIRFTEFTGIQKLQEQAMAHAVIINIIIIKPDNNYIEILCRRHHLSVREQWFQQDGAPPHTINANLAWLRSKFGDRLISRRCDFPWPARSPDLTPPDFFWWGHLKEHCFAPKPTTLDELMVNISNAVQAIPVSALKVTFQNMRRRLELCIERSGGHFEHMMWS
jgi:hypothetical protein